MIEVLAAGPYATVQDLGRPGYAHLGVPRSGGADLACLRLANRLVGNPESAATIEMTFGGARLRFLRGAWAALTGAPCRGNDHAAPFWVPPGADLVVGAPSRGLRTYLAVRGGITVPAVLGSRSTDSLSGLGPEPLRAGTLLPVGRGAGPITTDHAPHPEISSFPDVRIIAGPRDDWFDRPLDGVYEVSAHSNRAGVRLLGPKIARRRGELPSEGMVTGSVQVPPDGLPIVFLADHPPTGGYPVIGVVVTADLPAVAQLRPGDRLRFRPT